MKILFLGKLGFKTCVLKNISFHTHAFLFLIFNALRYVFKNSVFFFFKTRSFIQIFDWSIVFFDQSKFLLKILVSLCLVRLIEPIFRSIEHRESSFFKNSVLTYSTIFSKLFKTFFSLSDSARLHRNFLSFSSKILEKFLSP